MTKHRLYVTLAGVAAAALLVGGSLAASKAVAPPSPDAPPPALHRGPGMMVPGLLPSEALEHIAQRLGLSDAQRQSIKDLYAQARPGLEQLHQQARASAEQLARTRPDDPAYASAVSNASQALGEAASQLVLKGSQLRSQVFGVLTPEQKAKLVTLEDEMRARWSQHGGHGGHGGHGWGPPHGPPAPPPAGE